jgi:hypothetical protein
MKWMSGENYCEADFSVFASLLGYAFDGENPVDRHVHSPGTKPDKDKLVDLYDSIGVVGFIEGLLPLYDQVIHIFRENIAPSGGNNDVIRTSLVDLLYLAHECATSSDPDENFTLDVMDFIYHEIKDAIIQRNTLPYAPYIMLLIKHCLQEYDLSDDCKMHTVKRNYIKRKKMSTAPSTAYPSTFMVDARNYPCSEGSRYCYEERSQEAHLV